MFVQITFHWFNLGVTVLLWILAAGLIYRIGYYAGLSKGIEVTPTRTEIKLEGTN